MGPEEETVEEVEDRIRSIEIRRHEALSIASERIMKEFEPELRQAQRDLGEALQRKAFAEAINSLFKHTMGILKKH